MRSNLFLSKLKIDAVIFDMDGVLIDSEPFWQEAEIAVFKTVGLNLTHDDCVQTMGLRLDKAVEYWYQYQPWAGESLKTIEKAILNGVIDSVKDHGQIMSGVHDCLNFLSQQNIKLAIASSSDLELIETVVDSLQIRHYFDELVSAQFEPYGKPHPGVYLTTAKKLDVVPSTCLVIEDSMRGILAAKAAEMLCLAVPDPSLRNDPRLSIADWQFTSLSEFNQDFWNTING